MVQLRQVGVVGADGSVATVTGRLCIDHAGDVIGEGFAVQANMMSTPDVWPAMAAAFIRSSGPLARRLLTALVAGEAAGGDARGTMAAALMVVGGVTSAHPGAGQSSTSESTAAAIRSVISQDCWTPRTPSPVSTVPSTN
jgi:uncharacterized Ntn-hydrolase superfamily protein